MPGALLHRPHVLRAFCWQPFFGIFGCIEFKRNAEVYRPFFILCIEKFIFLLAHAYFVKNCRNSEPDENWNVATKFRGSLAKQVFGR